jgi:Glycosyl hydrolase catalytic core
MHPRKQAAAALLLLGFLAAIIFVSLHGGFGRAQSAEINDALNPKHTPTISDQSANNAKRSDDGKLQRNPDSSGTTLSNSSFFESNDHISSPPPLPGKKGIGMTLYPENWRLHLDLIKTLNVSWNYSWGAHRIATQPSYIEFVPMIWGRYAVLEQLVGDIIPEFEAKRIHRFLTFNEPDNSKQSNIAVKSVIDDYWPVLENAKIPMSSPAAIHPLGNWSREFCKHAEVSCLRMDYTALHWYGPANLTTFQKNMIEAYELYGRRPILLTEFAVADWDAKTPEENRVRREMLLGRDDSSYKPLLPHSWHSILLTHSFPHSLDDSPTPH